MTTAKLLKFQSPLGGVVLSPDARSRHLRPVPSFNPLSAGSSSRHNLKAAKHVVCWFQSPLVGDVLSPDLGAVRRVRLPVSHVSIPSRRGRPLADGCQYCPHEPLRLAFQSPLVGDVLSPHPVPTPRRVGVIRTVWRGPGRGWSTSAASPRRFVISVHCHPRRRAGSCAEV